MQGRLAWKDFRAKAQEVEARVALEARHGQAETNRCVSCAGLTEAGGIWEMGWTPPGHLILTITQRVFSNRETEAVCAQDSVQR